jgi:hypothetical protein
MAGNDAYIAVFDAKYTYDLWRPITAIRNADQTNNNATPRDASWRPLGDTPMHPEYPCAHCITSAAVSAVIQGVAGGEIGKISMTSATAPGVIRKWTRLQDYSEEVSMARIYAGFHYRFSTIVGKDMGKKIGELIVATQMRRAESASAQPRRHANPPTKRPAGYTFEQDVPQPDYDVRFGSKAGIRSAIAMSALPSKATFAQCLLRARSGHRL